MNTHEQDLQLLTNAKVERTKYRNGAICSLGAGALIFSYGALESSVPAGLTGLGLLTWSVANAIAYDAAVANQDSITQDMIARFTASIDTWQSE